MNVQSLSKQELKQIVLDQLDMHVAPNTTEESMHDLLHYRETELPVNTVDLARKAMIEYITKNKGQLSLPCSGDCTQHADGVVFYCYTEFLKEKDGKDN